jgi:hypothetical protein
VVASFTSRVPRVRFDVAVQTSNAYRFNIPLGYWPAHTNHVLEQLPPDLAAALAGLKQCI